jgi:hypothetical protein
VRVPLTKTATAAAQVDAALAGLPAKMATTLPAIKHAAPHARVVVLPYLRVVPVSASPCPPSVPIEAADLRFLVDFGQRLYTVIKQAAAAANGGVGEVPASSACSTPTRPG